MTYCKVSQAQCTSRCTEKCTFLANKEQYCCNGRELFLDRWMLYAILGFFGLLLLITCIECIVCCAKCCRRTGRSSSNIQMYDNEQAVLSPVCTPGSAPSMQEQDNARRSVIANELPQYTNSQSDSRPKKDANYTFLIISDQNYQLL